MFIRFCLSFLISIVSFFASGQPNAFQNINTSYDEQNPVVSPDGKTLFVTIANHPSNVGGVRDPGDIWISKLEDSQWSLPVHGGTLLNTRSYNGVAGVSADGNHIFLLSYYGSQGVANAQGIAIAQRSSGGWSKPQNISIPYFQNKSNILSGYISSDYTVFVFSAETYGSFGVEDLYVCLKDAEGKWSAPKNLGSTINTQFQELSPSLSEDKQTLYFSSNGKKGYGSFDVFSATRLDNSWTNWSEPENIGAGVNTEGRELFYRVDAFSGVAIYTSTINSDGYGDVRTYKTNEPITPRDSAAVTSLNTTLPDLPADDVEKDEKADPSGVKIYGKVFSAKSGEAINARISFMGTSDTNALVSQESGYSLSVPADARYKIRIEAPGYISTLEDLDVNSYQMGSLEMNFRLPPLEKGTVVNLKNVLFEQASTKLLAESYPELDLVVAFLKENPKVKIELAGHTDNRGVASHNVRLSQARVDKVKEYLVSKGIDKKRIEGKGYGGSKPIADNDTEETRRLNRRVEFIIRRM